MIVKPQWPLRNDVNSHMQIYGDGVMLKPYFTDPCELNK